MVELHKKIIAISGLSGFVGRNLEVYLKGKFELMPLSRVVLPQIVGGQLTGCSSIVHLAGKAHDLKNASSPDEYYKVNFELTCKLYDAFLASDVEKFIFVSSVKAAADSLDEPLVESRDSDPKTHYGLSKLKAEQYIMSKPLPANKSYYILRPCMIHGPGNKGNLNLLYQLVAKGIPYPLAAFNNRRSFLSIENFCFIIKEIISRNDIPSGIYHLADDESLSTNDLINLISQALDRAPRLLRLPVSMIKILARIGDKLHLPLTTERLHKLTENYVVSNQKIKLALKKNLPLSASEGILKTARAFKNA